MIEISDLRRSRPIRIIPDVVAEGAKTIVSVLDLERMAMISDNIFVISLHGSCRGNHSR